MNPRIDGCESYRDELMEAVCRSTPAHAHSPALRAHLSRCAACREQLCADGDLVSELERALRPEPLSETEWSRIRSRLSPVSSAVRLRGAGWLLGSAAAAAAVMGIVFTPALDPLRDAAVGDGGQGAIPVLEAVLSDLEAAQLRDVLARVAWDVADGVGLSAAAVWVADSPSESALARSLLPWDENDDWDRPEREGGGV